jgi:predicted lipoprotein with Yx(FWY)xxD motif
MKRHLAILAAALAIAALPGIAAAADTQTVEGRAIPGHGTLLVASSNKMTVYTFDNDVAGSGVSACTGSCLATWPALTVPAGVTPTGGPGVTGTLGTIVRTDNGASQVTYNGLPLYFFAGDSAPGDTNGIYTNWRAVQLTAAAPSPTATSTPRPAASEVPGYTEGPAQATPPSTSTAPAGERPPSGGVPLPLLAIGVAAAVGLALAARRLGAGGAARR